jgi:hypothetical protein
MKFFKQSVHRFLVTIVFSSMFMQGHGLGEPIHEVEESAIIPEISEAEAIIYLANQKPTVIMGHMKHCSHCTKLKKFAETLPAKYPQIDFFIVNGPETKLHKKVDDLSKSKFRIPGYPSIVFVRDGKIKHVQIGGHEKNLKENIQKLLNNKF